MKMKEKGKTITEEGNVNSGDSANQKPGKKNSAEQAKLQEIGKKYIRIPHPVLKNTFILKQKI